jgi:hypothetical protein
MPERLVVELGQRVPVSIDVGRVRRSPARWPVDEAVVPRDDLDLDVQLREVAEHACRVGLGRVEEEQEAGEDHLRLVIALVGALGHDGTRREREHAESPPCLSPRSSRELGVTTLRPREHTPSCATCVQIDSNVREGALRDRRRSRPASPPSAITIVRRFLRKS